MKKQQIALLCLAGCLLAGCSSVNTVERANPVASKKMVNDKRVITDGGLDDYAYIAGVNESCVGDLLKVQVTVTNSTTGYRAINYKFTWFDENGIEVNTTSTPWMTTTIEGGETKNLVSTAPSPKAKDFTLKLLPNVR